MNLLGNRIEVKKEVSNCPIRTTVVTISTGNYSASGTNLHCLSFSQEEVEFLLKALPAVLNSTSSVVTLDTPYKGE